MATVDTGSPQSAAQQHPGRNGLRRCRRGPTARPAGVATRPAADRSDAVVPPGAGRPRPDGSWSARHLPVRACSSMAAIAARRRRRFRGLGRGAHRVRLVRDGYSPKSAAWSSPAPLRPSRWRLRSRATPQPSHPAHQFPRRRRRPRPFVGALSVDSRPDGAACSSTASWSAATPLTSRRVPAGEHAVRLEREGYRRWSSSVRVVASGQNSSNGVVGACFARSLIWSFATCLSGCSPVPERRLVRL